MPFPIHRTKSRQPKEDELKGGKHVNNNRNLVEKHEDATYLLTFVTPPGIAQSIGEIVSTDDVGIHIRSG